MNKRASKEPYHTEGTAAEKAARKDRLAAEMRKNLMKRKQQQREKSADLGAENADPAKPEGNS